eukprot:scaffold4545_cov139-Amphora_coffeaeformis.AAC.3
MIWKSHDLSLCCTTAPVLHVNADRILDVHYAAQVAANYRQRFGKDIFLQLWGYRRHGHNEVDEPRMTNVDLYHEVDRHKPVTEVALQAVENAELRTKMVNLQQRIADEFRQSSTNESIEKARAEKVNHHKASEWRNLWTRPPVAFDTHTGVSLEQLQKALEVLSSVPGGFLMHSLTKRTISRRADLLEKTRTADGLGSMVDWATAELLALSTLAADGHLIRLCGQDSQRGTFGQRHAVWHDGVTGKVYPAVPSGMQVVDSPLSELAVVGFEHGISLSSPFIMTLWEAQFGDFVNNAQTLIDTMICSEKEKFRLESNFVMLLPHGYDGMGPEHSSCRLERFLTLHTDTPGRATKEADLDRYSKANFVVEYPSTPSNYFHLLRRSFSWPFRRPMIVATPKRTLRLPQAASPIYEFLDDNEREPEFQPVIDDPRPLDREAIRLIALCSGEMFYDLMISLDSLPSEAAQSVAVVRVEELAPFPLKHLSELIKSLYPNTKRLMHTQEEPLNMGSHRFMVPFLAHLGQSLGIHVDDPIARPTSTAPAVGDPEEHADSQSDLFNRFHRWVQENAT